MFLVGQSKGVILWSGPLKHPTHFYRINQNIVETFLTGMSEIVLLYLNDGWKHI